MTIVIIVIAVVLLAGFGVILYNRLVRLRNRVEEAWAQIDVQLQCRHDLIPNLVNTVKGYTAHEKSTLEEVTAARAAAAFARQYYNDNVSEWNTRISSVPNNFVAMLMGAKKADQNLRQLRDEIDGGAGAAPQGSF